MEESKISETVLPPETGVDGTITNRDAQGSQVEGAGESPLGDSDVVQDATETNGNQPPVATDGQPPLSKSQQKKLKRRQAWEDQKGDRKRRRKEKKQNQQARKRAEKETKIAEAEAAGLDPQEVLRAMKPVQREKQQVPVALIIDCGFEEYMTEMELISLSSQITRSYSANRSAAYQAHIFMSSWKGMLKTRFETVLNSTHTRWPYCHFMDDDFVKAAEEAREVMKGPYGGKMTDVLRVEETSMPVESEKRSVEDSSPIVDPEETASDTSVVYLTSESPNTLERLEPFTSYVIGGIVDKNRHKGLCYKQARMSGVRTAKLPIGDYMQMASRQVLTTNQVVEIMLKWLERGDWGTAFAEVIPKRKGGLLKTQQNEEGRDESDEAVSPADLSVLEQPINQAGSDEATSGEQGERVSDGDEVPDPS